MNDLLKDKNGVSNLLVVVLFVLLAVVVIAILGTIIIKNSSKLGDRVIIQEIVTDCKGKYVNDESGYNNCVIEQLKSNGISTEGFPSTSQAAGDDGSNRGAVRIMSVIYSSGIPMPVVINVSLNGSDCGGAIVETLPSGWNASSITGVGSGVFNTADNKIRWGPINSSSCTEVSRSFILGYVATPNAAQTGTKTFSGVISIDGINSDITGVTSVSDIGGGTSTSISIGACRILDQSGTTYVLNQSINNYAGTCFTITADNIVLDLNGFSVDGTERSESDYGVFVNGRNNVTIRNGVLTGFGDCNGGTTGSGIRLSNSNNVLIKDIFSLSNNCYGIYLSSSSNNTLTGITANSNRNGIYLSSSSNNTLTGINATSNNNGIYLWLSSSNALSGIIANSNMYGISLIAQSSNNVFGGVVSSSSEYDLICTSSNSNSIVGLSLTKVYNSSCSYV